MKIFLKNAGKIFLIIFFILSILNLIFQITQEYFSTIPTMIKVVESVSQTGISAEESYNVLASVYEAGAGTKISSQLIIIPTAAILSILLNIIITFIKNKK